MNLLPENPSPRFLFASTLSLFILLIGGSCSLFVWVEDTTIKRELQTAGERLNLFHNGLEVEFRRQAGALVSLRTLFEASQHVTNTEFMDAVSSLDTSKMTTFGWAPRVTPDQAEEFLAWAKTHIDPDFTINDKQEETSDLPCYPTTYLAGQESSSIKIGTCVSCIAHDLPQSREATLHRPENGELHIVLALLDPLPSEESQIGYFISALPLEDFLHAAWSHLELLESSLVLEILEDGDFLPIFGNFGENEDTATTPLTREFQLGDTSLRLHYWPTQKGYYFTRDLFPFTVLISGILLSIVVTTLVYVLLNSNVRISNKVREQTKEISRANRKLSEEITARRKAQQSERELMTHMHEMQKMEAIGTLAGGISHEFNNIISAILGNAELAKLSTDLDSETEGYLGDIIIASKRAGDLVKQMLTYGRKSKPQFEKTDAVDLVMEAYKLLKATFPKNISLELAIDDQPLWIVADRGQIQQVIINLCNNAWQAISPRSGHVTLGIKGKKDPDQVDYSIVTLYISDTGPGIPDDVLDNIYDPFFTTKPAGQGTGLGLSVVQGIIHDHGGSIRVETAKKAGTTFYVDFPHNRVRVVEKKEDIHSLNEV